MARTRRTPEEVLAQEEERARRQRDRVRAARARAAKANADHGAVVARHVGEAVIRMAAHAEHAGDARAVIDWAVSYMPARGQAARKRWHAPWDPAPVPDRESGEPAAPAEKAPAAPVAKEPPAPRSGWAKRLFRRRQRAGPAPAPAPEPAAPPLVVVEAPPQAPLPEPEPEAPAPEPQAPPNAREEWETDGRELAALVVVDGDVSTPAALMEYAQLNGISEGHIPVGVERWRYGPLMNRGWKLRQGVWYAPPCP